MDLGDGRSLGDIIALKIGSNICGRFDIIQDEINPNKETTIKCNQAANQMAGKYNISEQVVPGYASNKASMRKSSWINEYYEFTVMPTISAVSSHSGTFSGDTITITGTGFAKEPSKISVKVDNTPCTVS